MTLRRKMGYEIVAMLIGLLLISGASLWGLDGLHHDFGSAIEGYEELRRVYEISSHVATARTLLELPQADEGRALVEVQTAGDKLDLFAAGTKATGQREEIHLAVKSQLSEAVRLLRLGWKKRGSEDAGALMDSLNGVLSEAANLASVIRREIGGKQAAAEAKRRTTMIVMSVLSATIVIGSVVIGVKQYRSVTRPLKRFGDASRRIAGGHFSERVPAEGAAEFVAMAEDFNRMAGELEGLYRELEQKVAAKSKELVRSERLASVGYLAAGVAHEVNNPIGIIAGHAELSLEQLRRRPGTETMAEVEKTLQIVCEEAFRCKEIVGKLLSLARPGEENRGCVCLATIAASVVSTVGGLGAYRSRRLTLRAEEMADLRVLANEGEMKQVVLNLAINALEAVAPETGEVCIAIGRADEDVELSVTDNGRGMSADVLDHVFEPFFTGKRGSGQPGTGLGLSITHAIVESHGGRIWGQSDGPGKGSRFVIRLPGLAKGGKA
ncbi:MAG TPA: HAMP domain-containing sensor histidine kinase [Tepidisphaeraceae bacterium]|nr:HAMP domain-containing sensor histidine kinase [Tepidisphaeraceae bacterium]